MAIHRIRNTQTGEVKLVDDTQLPSYGIASTPTPTTPPSASMQSEAPQGNFLTNIASFFAPKATETVGDLFSGAKLRLQNFSGKSGTELSQSTDYAKQAMQTSNPAEKQRLLALSRGIDKSVGERTNEFVKGVRPLTESEQKKGGKGFIGNVGDYAAKGYGSAAEVGSYFVPTIGANRVAATTAGKVGNFLLRGAGTGAVEGALSSIDDENGNLLENIGTGALFGSVMGASTEGVKEVVKGLYGQLKPYAKALRRAQFGAEKVDEKFAEKTLKEGVPTSYKKMIPYAQKVYDIADVDLDELVAKENFIIDDFAKKIDTTEQGFRGNLKINEVLTDLQVELTNKGRFKEADALSKTLDSLNGDGGVTLQEANFVRKQLDGSVNETFKLAQSEIDSTKKASRRLVADIFRDTIRNDPKTNPLVKKLLDTQSFALQLKDVANIAEAKAANRVIPSWYVNTALIGGITGFATGGIPGAVLGGTGGIAISEFLRSPKGSQALYNLGTSAKVPRVGDVGEKLLDFMRKSILTSSSPYR